MASFRHLTPLNLKYLATNVSSHPQILGSPNFGVLRFYIKGRLVKPSGRCSLLMRWDVKCKGAKVGACLCSESDVFARESEHMNVDVLSIIQRSLWCCIHLSLYAQKSTWHPDSHFISHTCLFWLITGNSHRQLIVSCIFAPPLSAFSFGRGMPDVRSKEVLPCQALQQSCSLVCPFP